MYVRPKPRPRLQRSEGFTLVEVAFVVSLILLVTVIGYPAFNEAIRKVRTQNYLSEVNATLLRAQREATLRGVPVIADPNPATGEIVVWANVDRDGALTYSPDPGAAPRTADYEVLRHDSDGRTKVQFVAPPALKGGDSGPVSGLTTLASGRDGFVFEPNGSVRDVGGLRIGDVFGNYFEVRAEPAATGKVRVLKWRDDPPGEGAAGFYPRGTEPVTGQPYWEWSTKYQSDK